MHAENSVHSSRRLPAVFAAAIVLSFVFLVPPPLADAYLMMVREGQEAPDLPNVNDFLGATVATGDFNGDGFDDLATAAPDENLSLTPHQHGAVVINYGSERGITEVGSQFLTVGAVDDDKVQYGRALAVGNFNNDAYDDLAVGLPYLDGDMGNIESSGEVWIHLGGPTGLQTTPDLVIDETWGGAGTLEAGDRFGAALTAGDFNLDSYDDLVVGAPGEDNGSGAVFVFAGDPGGISSGAAQALDPSQVGTGPEADGGFGSALAAGDMFSGAEEDLAIGAPYRDVGGHPDAGQVYLVPGSALGLTATGAFHVDYQELGATIPDNAQLGYSLAVGHFWDEAGIPNQLAMGAPGGPDCSTTCVDNVGEVVILHDFAPPFAVATSVVRVDQSDGMKANENEASDRFSQSVAAGDFDKDGFDDLAVGTPYETLENEPIGGITTVGAGQVFLWTGGSPTFHAANCTQYDGRTLNDTLETSAILGSALAFGKFDSTGRANLAIGAPGAPYRDYPTGDLTNFAGRVYILAPWRQPQSRPHRSSVVLDCDGQIIFAQRPFQAVTPASVTKALTVLLAVEAIQDGDIDSTAVITIPAWVANNVSGSQAGFVPGEKVRFVDLIKLAISISAGDACYAIGDTLTGGNHVWMGLDNTIPLWSNRMNIRADELGMLYSHFNNPSGRPLEDHFSAALDWARFGEQAMQNELFRYYVGRRVWPILNYNPTNNGWLQKAQDQFDPAIIGIKPGGNSLSQTTDLWSAYDPSHGRYFAAVFGIASTTWGSPFSDAQYGTGSDLLKLARAFCDADVYTPDPLTGEPGNGPWGTAPNIPTGPSAEPAACPIVPLDTGQSGDALIEIYPQELVNPPAMFSLTVRRSSELLLGPGESTTLSFTPAQAHQGFRLFNELRTAANLTITTSEPPGVATVMLDTDSAYVIPPLTPITVAYSLTIQNTSPTTAARLQVDELGYEIDSSVAPGAPFTATLSRDPHQVEEVVRACVQGQDAGDGNVVYLVMRPPGATTGVGPVTQAATASWQLYPARPNPFHGSTSLVFDLGTAGPVWASVHDVGGRRVRTLSNGAVFRAGHQVLKWDGRDEAGRLVPAGIYFQRVRTANGVGTARVIRLR